MSQEKLKALSKKLTETTLARLKASFRRKPSKKKMEETISTLLSQSAGDLSPVPGNQMKPPERPTEQN